MLKIISPSPSTLARFDEVDEANPEKKPEVHNVVLAGKRKAQLPFEEHLRPPSGKLTNKLYVCALV